MFAGGQAVAHHAGVVCAEALRLFDYTDRVARHPSRSTLSLIVLEALRGSSANNDNSRASLRRADLHKTFDFIGGLSLRNSVDQGDFSRQAIERRCIKLSFAEALS